MQNLVIKLFRKTESLVNYRTLEPFFIFFFSSLFTINHLQMKYMSIYFLHYFLLSFFFEDVERDGILFHAKYSGTDGHTVRMWER